LIRFVNIWKTCNLPFKRQVFFVNACTLLNFQKVVIITGTTGHNDCYNSDKDGDYDMRKPRKRSFEELVAENKLQLLRDREALDKIEVKLEEKRLGKAE
jgi:hypothetical protein